MSSRFLFRDTFVGGYAQGDKKILDALHIKLEPSKTFHLTQSLPKVAKETKDYKDHHHKQNPALTIEECKPDGDYHIGLCIPLPSNVSENSIFNNIISSFKHSFQAHHEKKVKSLKDKFRQRKFKPEMRPVSYKDREGRIRVLNDPEDDLRVTKYFEDDEDRVMKQLELEEETTRTKLDKKLDAWKVYLRLPQNRHVISDAFWYMRYHLVKEPESEEITEFLLGRMAKNYIDLFLSVSGTYKESFFKNYFNILSQGVFYSFFYACPKSRDELNDRKKRVFLSQFSILFAGIEISNAKDYYSNWYLDLGAGNILKDDDSAEEAKSLPTLMFSETIQMKVVRTQQDLRYCPIILTYLGSENYQTRNVVKGYKMKFTQISTDKEEVEKRFEMYRKVAKDVNQNLKKFKEEDKEAKKKLKFELKKLREESWNHQRRLSRRRDEELEKGAHEYGNFLVSILNAHSQNAGTQKM